MRKTHRKMAVIAAAGLVAAGGSAFTAANTVAATSAGFGAEAVTGFTVSDITYGLTTLSGTATDEEVDQVSFTLTADTDGTGPATSARARVTGAASSTADDAVYYDCTIDAAATTPVQTADADANVWDCVVGPNVKAADITGLSVVAAQ